MRADDLLCLRRTPFVPATTNSRHNWCVVPNLTRGIVLTGLDRGHVPSAKARSSTRRPRSSLAPSCARWMVRLKGLLSLEHAPQRKPAIPSSRDHSILTSRKTDRGGVGQRGFSMTDTPRPQAIAVTAMRRPPSMTTAAMLTRWSVPRFCPVPTPLAFVPTRIARFQHRQTPTLAAQMLGLPEGFNAGTGPTEHGPESW
jgi:hypothetical protein